MRIFKHIYVRSKFHRLSNPSYHYDKPFNKTFEGCRCLRHELARQYQKSSDIAQVEGVSPVRGARVVGLACFVRMPGIGQCPPLGMGYHFPKRYPEQYSLAAGQACHECNSKYIAGVPEASHGVDGRPNSGVYSDIRAASTGPESKAK
ncbi:hypothetical protein PoB_003944300 [Plakobranchus ocellatus]|uniref:Uncharacterized protein n=1 Tax=Plakobranchus ocellatus TaxID=259542 RepID=A0AAV4B051_9GAST|nr:hypothetical protein PoB_003944300 [Plakobranchus ocellatus]